MKWNKWRPYRFGNGSATGKELLDAATESKIRGDGGWSMCGNNLTLVVDDGERLEAYECTIVRIRTEVKKS